MIHRVLNLGDEVFLKFRMVGLGKVKSSGQGLSALRNMAGEEQDLAQDSVHVSRVGRLLRSSLSESERFGKAVLAE